MTAPRQTDLFWRPPAPRAPAGPPPLRALSLDQPWAWHWVMGHKRYETRSWRHAHRGPLLVHATRGGKAYQRDACTEIEAIAEIMAAEGVSLATLPRGAFVGVVYVLSWRSVTGLLTAADFERFEDELGNFEPGRYAIDAIARRVFADPVPWPGRQGVWTVTDPTAFLRSEVEACRRDAAGLSGEAARRV